MQQAVNRLTNIGSESSSAPLLRLPSVVLLTGLSRSTIYQMISEHRFPRPVRLGTRAVAWRRSDLEQWTARLPVAYN